MQTNRISSKKKGKKTYVPYEYSFNHSNEMGKNRSSASWVWFAYLLKVVQWTISPKMFNPNIIWNSIREQQSTNKYKIK